MQKLTKSFARHRPAFSTKKGPPVNISTDRRRFMLSCKLRTSRGYSTVETLIDRNDWRKVLTTMVDVDRKAALTAISVNLDDLLEGKSEDEIAAIREIFDNPS